MTDISRQLRLQLPITSNDAKACYNRIILWLASLALKRIGLSSTAAFLITNTLQSATHNKKTAFGESTQQYTLQFLAEPKIHSVLKKTPT